MKIRLRRICALVLAIVMLVTTCLAELPDGSLKFLGGMGVGIVSAFSNEEAEAASSTTKITLTSKYSSATISEIGRNSEGMWFFTRNSDTGSKKTVFCMNSGKSLGSNDTYKYTTTSAIKYSNQSLAKAMTWWFGSTSRGCVAEGAYNNGSSYGSLTAAQTQAAVQAYVWACCTSGASKETTVKQVLKNYCGLSENKAKSYAKSIVNAISDTYVYGTIYYYSLKTCGHSSKKGADKHQTLLSWSGTSTSPKTDSYNTSGSDTGSLTLTITINKKDKSTGTLIDTADFKVTYGGQLLTDGKEVSIKSGSITSVKVTKDTYAAYTSSTSRFTTKDGKVKFTYKISFTTKTYTTKSYKYVTNWDDLDYWTQKEYSDKGYYQNKSKAKAAAKKELESGLEKYVSAAKASIRGKAIKVTEISAPKGHGLPSTTSQKSTAEDSLKVTFTFSDAPKYGKVTVVKKEGKSTGYDVTGATLKGAVYGVYANEIIYGTDNKTVLYDKDAKIAEITTGSDGTGSTGNILPVGYNYYVKEITPSKGYTLDTSKHTFKITYNSDSKIVESETVSSSEDHEQKMRYGAVSVIKSAKRSSEYIGDGATLSGATYTVYADETIYDVNGTTVLYSKGAAITTITTDTNGYGKSGEVIPAGIDSDGYKYYLLETEASTGYVLDTQKYYFYVRAIRSGSSYSVTVKDASGNIVNGALNSGNAIKSSEDSIWGYVAVNKYTKDANGTVNLEGAAVFYVVELDAVLSATGARNQSAAKAKIKEMTSAQRTKLIEDIKDSDASAIKYMLTTDSKGYAKSGILAMGEYMLIQTIGADGYDLEQYYFSIMKDSGKTYTYDIYNVQTARISVSKTKSSRSASGALIEEPEEGAVFYILYASKAGKTVEELNAMETADQRQAWVDSLDSSAVYAVLTTDEYGDAVADVDAGVSYIIYQTYGDPYCKLANADLKTFAAGELKTYYYDASNPQPYTKLSVTKTLADTLGNLEGAEEGALFAVIKADYVTLAEDEINEMEASERAAYVTGLTDEDEACLIATITAGADGVASVYWNESEYTGNFVVIQTYGEENYALMPVMYSVEATESGIGTDGSAVMKKVTGTDADGLEYIYYSFEYTDKYNGGSEFTIEKRLSDVKGNDVGAEVGAVFAVIKADYVTLTEDEINALDADGRANYVEEITETDSSSIIATLTTSADGDASFSWTNKEYEGAFVVIQIAGEDGYALMPVMYSADATDTGIDVNGNQVLKLYNDGKTAAYSISYTDPYEDWGMIAVHKVYESANGTWTDESGATFTVLNDADEEVAWITTDDSGYGVAVYEDGSEAALPFGIYFVHQTATGIGAQNTDMAEDELVILTQAERQQTVSYESKNPAQNYELTVTKLSDDTAAPVAGAAYTITAAEDILAANGSVEYEKGTTVATILTDEYGEGSAWVPYGTYYIEESISPYDFVKDTDKVSFTLDVDGITVSGGVSSAATLVTETEADGSVSTYYAVSYTTYDTPVYGTISVTKDGQVLDGAAAGGGFSYVSEALDGAVFALYARNDITNDAGDVVWASGTYITSATTDSTGKAQFFWDKDNDGIKECADFYLGDYYIVETYAPDGYICDDTEHDITLTWDKTPQNENEMAEAGSVGDTGESYGSDIGYESSGKYVLKTGSDFNELIADAVTVTFTWISPVDGTQTVDVSHDADGTVIMWDDGDGNYYISTQDVRQAVVFNGDSSYMFYRCSSLKEVRFDSVDTSKVFDMSYMFYMCTMLTELDLSYFDTTNVGYFDYMFCGCTSLVTIYATEPGGTTLDPVYSEDTWTTGIIASASGSIMEGDTITWEDFSFTRLYTADYIVENVEESITLSESDIASITPSIASTDNSSVTWIESSAYTIDVEIILAEGSTYYCTDGAYSNILTATVTVTVPDEIEVEADESPAAKLSVSDTPVTVDIEVYKVDSSGSALAGAVFTLYANCDIVNSDDDVIVTAGSAIMESETLGETAPVISFEGLPTDMYAVDGTYLDEAQGAVYCYADGTTGNTAKGKSMFYVKETTVPVGYEADGATYYLTGALSDYTGSGGTGSSAGSGTGSGEEADGVISYTFTAVNTELDYLTLQKAWDDAANSGNRPEYVVFLASADGADEYVIVMYEERTYLFDYASSAGKTVYENGVTSAALLDSALCYWKTTLTSEGRGQSEIVVWSAALDSGFILIGGESGFASPFTVDSGYTFAESADLLTKIAVNAAGSTGYRIESEGWTNMDKNVWRITNYISSKYTDSAVLKEWNDYDDELGIRPQSISVTLYKEDSNGNISAVFIRTLSEANSWSYSTADDAAVSLDRYDSSGKEYSYYWEETTSELPEGYSLSDTKCYYSEIDGIWYTQLTNSLNVTIPVSVQKIWNDDDNAHKIRPETVYMRLYANGTWVDVNGNAVTSQTTDDTAVALTESNGWKATLKGLPKYGTTGKEISYKFVEVTSPVTLIVGGAEVTLGAQELSWYTADSVTGYKLSYSYAAYGTGTAYTQTTVTNTHEYIKEGKITVVKYGSDGQSGLSGVTFAISNEDGEIVDAQVTDEYGKVVFDELPIGTYRICETETVTGYSLLAQEITATIPYVLTQENLDEYEAQGIHVDTSNAILSNGEYYFYELTYEVTDTWNLNMPYAGGAGVMPKLLIPFALIIIFIAFMIKQKKSKPVAKNGW